MNFFSHSKKTNGVIEGTKLIKDHTDGVLEKSISRLTTKVDLGFNEKELTDLVSLIVKLHDIGKYTSYFQNYILQKKPIDNLLKQHARIGGLVAYNFLKEKDKKLAIIALVTIFLHHSKLIDIIDIPQKLNQNLQSIFQKQKVDVEKIISVIESDIHFENFNKFLYFPDEQEIRRAIRIWSKKENNIQYYFLINYIFSILIEADKLDASDTQLYILIPLPSSAVDDRFNKASFVSNNTDVSKLSNNELRNFCRAEVISNLNQEDILDHFLFTLTAPTGIGKTMIALDFALKLKEKIRKEERMEAPIIYALPFINIIEQAINEYEITLPKEAKILGHYQFADIFGKNEDNDEQNYNQKLMSLDTWQCDIVITSFVQFFETLIGNRNKLLKKFNHFAGAIIILDEVQTLRLDQMPLIGAVLFYLSKFLKSRVILMTATKPMIFELAKKEILSTEEEEVNVLELLSNHKQVFECFNRTQVIPIINIEFPKNKVGETFVEKFFSTKWMTNKSCLIVCNTVNRSIELFKNVQFYLKYNNFPNNIYYLSTNILPIQRFNIIQQLKKELTDGLFPILISTQVVEAGVDLDFDMGFRDIGPIDSIIQVAGRVNRNNNLSKKNSPLYIVDFNDASHIYGRITYEQSKKALNEKVIILEKEYLNLISTYFENISDRSSFVAYRKIFESMKMLRYDSENKEDYPVSSFKIIEDSKNTRAVFIEIDERASEAKDKFQKLLRKEITKEDFEPYKKDFNQRIIAVPDYYLKSLKQESNTILSDNLLMVPKDLVKCYYGFETGFIRKKEFEDENKIVML